MTLATFLAVRFTVFGTVWQGEKQWWCWGMSRHYYCIHSMSRLYCCTLWPSTQREEKNTCNEYAKMNRKLATNELGSAFRPLLTKALFFVLGRWKRKKKKTRNGGKTKRDHVRDTLFTPVQNTHIQKYWPFDCCFFERDICLAFGGIQKQCTQTEAKEHAKIKGA